MISARLVMRTVLVGRLTIYAKRQVVGATALDVEDGAAPFELSRALSSNLTQGVPDMVAPVKAAAGRVGEASPPMSNHLADDRDEH